jgi:2TM domain
MAQDDDEFEGIDISGPWGGVRIGSGGVRVGRDFIHDDDRDVRQARRRVRDQLNFFKHLTYFAVIVGGLALINWATGGTWWIAWVAGICGAILAMQFVGIFVAPALWGRDVEERMLAREMERRRGRVHVTPPPSPPPPAPPDND